MSSIQALHELGQSLWLDYIQRDLIVSHELQRLIEAGEVRGVTSNPTIFEQAIAGSELYTASLRPLAQAGWPSERMLETLSIDDIRAATDLFLPLYEATNGGDGFVSIEVNPNLAADAEASLDDARRLWSAVNRPNVMIKIPATREGLAAIERALYEGINVNVTLIFSLERYAEVMEAYLRALESRLSEGASIDHIASVASFFVSRVDSKVDALLEKLLEGTAAQPERVKALMGKIAIANAKLAYAQFKGVFGSDRFAALSRRGARLQRPLWASTSTKNPAYPDTHYVDNLIGASTVNTLPPQTLEAFRDHGRAQPELERDLSGARAQLDALSRLGISMEQVTAELEQEGVHKFAQSYGSVLQTVQQKALPLAREIEPLPSTVATMLEELDRRHVGRRLWEADPTLWQAGDLPEEVVRQGLQWMRVPREPGTSLEQARSVVDQASHSGLEHLVVIGAGRGAALAGLLQVLWKPGQWSTLHVLDGKDPSAVRQASREAPPKSSLYLLFGDGSATAEARALVEHFWEPVSRLRIEAAGSRFIAMLEQGSPLASLVTEREFKACWEVPAGMTGVGGVLADSGVMLATLMGIEPGSLLSGAARMAQACGPRVDAARHPGLFLGALLAASTQVGRHCVSLLAEPGLQPLAEWTGRLIAASFGGAAMALLPVIDVPSEPTLIDKTQSLLVYLRRDGEFDGLAGRWAETGIPVVVQDVQGASESWGEEFYRWQLGVAAASVLLSGSFPGRVSQPPSDPLEGFARRPERRLAQPPLLWEGEGVTLWGPASSAWSMEETLEGAMDRLVAALREDPLALHVLIPPSQGILKAVRNLRWALRAGVGVITSEHIDPDLVLGAERGLPEHATRINHLVLTAPPARDLVLAAQPLSWGELAYARALATVRSVIQRGSRAYGLSAESNAALQRALRRMVAAVGRAGG